MRTRRVVGLLSLLALAAIGAAMAGLQVPGSRPGTSGGSHAPLAGVRAVAVTTLLRVGDGTPSGGELAFMAVEPSGNLLVSDRLRHSVLRFDAEGHLLSEWGPRLADLTLAEPAGVAAQGDALYVLDRGVPRLLRLDTTGRLQDWLSLESLGTYGLNGLSVDAEGNVFVADTGRNRLLVFSASGAPLRQIGHGGTGLGDFTQPMALAFLPDGGFVVADWENARLERFDRDFQAVDAWPIGFRPRGVAADADGRVYAPDPDRRRVVAYSPHGDVLGELVDAQSGALDVVPRQVAIGPTQPGSLYVLGSDGIVRVVVGETAPPPQSSGEVDLISPLVIALLLVLPVVAVVMRRRRASIATAADREIRLQAENGAQRQEQQPHADQQLLVTDQTEREGEATHQDYQSVGQRQAGHRA